MYSIRMVLTRAEKNTILMSLINYKAEKISICPLTLPDMSASVQKNIFSTNNNNIIYNKKGAIFK